MANPFDNPAIFTDSYVYDQTDPQPQPQPQPTPDPQPQPGKGDGDKPKTETDKNTKDAKDKLRILKQISLRILIVH